MVQDRSASPRFASKHQGHPWLTLLAAALGVMMVALDGTVVGVANPTIAKDLDASLAGLQWVTNGYLLAIAVLLILGGKLGDRFGRKRVFAAGIVGFAAASGGAAASSSIEMLIAFRVVQGVAGALLMPNTIALLRAAFPHDKLNQAVGIWGGTSAIAAASGPIVGGLLVQHVSWESIFLLNIPLGAVALLVTLLYVAESRDEASGRGLDPGGVVLLTAGLFALTWALIKVQDHGWGSAYVLGFGLGGIAILALFCLYELRVTAPLLPMGLFRSPSLSASIVILVAALFGLFGVLFFIGLYLQSVHGYSPVSAGVKMLPLTAVFGFSAPLGGMLTERFGPRWPMLGGMLLMAGSMLGFTGLEVDSAYSSQWPFFVMMGIGMGVTVVASTQAIVGNAPVEMGGVAGGLQTTANQLGGVIGTAVLGSVLAQVVGDHLPAGSDDAGTVAQVSQGLVPDGLRESVAHGAFMSGLHTSLWVSFAVMLVGAALALLVRRGHHVEGEPAGMV